MEAHEIIDKGRITVEMGVRAYQESGMEPRQGSYHHCGIGAVAAACDVSSFQMRDCLGAYGLSFVQGFDGESQGWVGLPGGRKWRERRRAYGDGRRLWEAVKDGVPPAPESIGIGEPLKREVEIVEPVVRPVRNPEPKEKPQRETVPARPERKEREKVPA